MVFNFLASKVVDAFQKNKEKTTTTDKLGTALEQVASQSEKAAPQLCTYHF